MAVLLCAFCVLLSAIGNVTAPRTFSHTSKRIIEAPNFTAYGEPACDADGNLFFHLGNGSFDHPDILEISHDGRSGAIYKVPPESDGIYFQQFFVTPAGNLYLLAQKSAKEFLILPFDSKGKPGDPVSLNLPEYLQVMNFVVFDDGSSLIAGYLGELANAKLRGNRYVSLYDPSGRLRKVLSNTEFGTVDLSPKQAFAWQGAATVGTDGNAYIVADDQILVVSPVGRIVRQLKFDKPEGGWVASRLNVSKGLLALSFSKIDKTNRIYREYLVMSATTGDISGIYLPTEETGSNDVCFDGAEGFTFMGSGSDNKVFLVTAPLN